MYRYICYRYIHKYIYRYISIYKPEACARCYLAAVHSD